MATKSKIGGGGELFIGEDKTLRLWVYDRDVVSLSPTNVPLDANGVACVPIDITGWAIKFTVRKKVTIGPDLIAKDATVVGVWNVDPLVNTQHAEVILTDDDLGILVFTKAETCQHSWKRLDENVETVLAYTDFEIEQATQV